ncbi:protein of unknown function [Devosia crocina]|uniref:DUF4214 domain-containing protein n=1 Tax=Devosia crocina TaxID=429728 RepID=A0A1I7MXB8_9HYPH|nr:DUF4214 domain-containing protein [Devosia crocina]SFV27018.1 protein of unknown function [Devosia crocina]
MAVLGGLLNLNDTLTNVLGGRGGSSNSGLLSPVTNLVANLVSIGGEDGSGATDLLNLGLLTEEGVVELNLLGQELIVLPNNGGIIDTDLLDGSGGLLGSVTNILQLDGLLGEAGLLDLTGILGEGGILDLSGILGSVLGLLSPGGALDPDDHLDPDGEVDPDSFDNVFVGTSGNDNFIVPTSSTYIDGKGGIDTADFARSSEGMSFAVGDDAVLFAQDDTLYYFKDVERVNFFEGTLYLDTGAGENAGMAYRLYQAAFDRMPDAEGLEYWIGRLDSGNTNLAAIADSFIHSPEFIRTFGTEATVSNAEFVELLYQHTLDRGSDGPGYDYWVERLDSNQTNRGDLLAFFSESDENQAQVASQIDNGIWIA